MGVQMAAAASLAIRKLDRKIAHYAGSRSMVRPSVP